MIAFAGREIKSMKRRGMKKQNEHKCSLADRKQGRGEVLQRELPAGRPPLHFLAGVASFDVLGSENEAVLVAAGV